MDSARSAIDAVASDLLQEQDRLKTDLEQTIKEIDNIIGLIMNGADSETLAAKLKGLEAKKRNLETSLAAIKPFTAIALPLLQNTEPEALLLLRKMIGTTCQTPWLHPTRSTAIRVAVQFEYSCGRGGIIDEHIASGNRCHSSHSQSAQYRTLM